MKGSNKQERYFLFFGVLLILTGMLCNEWMLAFLFSKDGVVEISQRIVIWSFDIIMVTAGLIMIWRRKSLKIRQLVYNAIAIGILLFIVEMGLHAVSFFIQFGKARETIDRTYLMSPYEGKPWAKELFKEYDELIGEYKQFRGWGKNEFHGKYVNIAADGERKTWNSEDFGTNTPKRLYFFGPSAAWGYGSRDEYTLPSQVSRELNRKGYTFTVHNYGEWSYTFNQQLFFLMTLLRDGHRPDYVVFYAWSDIYTAYQSGVPGSLHFDFVKGATADKMTDMQQLRNGLTNIIKKNFLIYRQTKKILEHFDSSEPKFTEVAHTYSDEALKKLLADTVDYFSRSYAMMEGLSKEYGFQYMTFWPPILFLEESMNEEEKSAEFRLQDKTLMKLYGYAEDIFTTGSFPYFYNISDTLKGRSKTYYLDFGHLSEEGNEAVAKRVVSTIEKEYLLNE